MGVWYPVSTESLTGAHPVMQQPLVELRQPLVELWQPVSELQGNWRCVSAGSNMCVRVCV